MGHTRFSEERQRLARALNGWWQDLWFFVGTTLLCLTPLILTNLACSRPLFVGLTATLLVLRLPGLAFLEGTALESEPFGAIGDQAYSVAWLSFCSAIQAFGYSDARYRGIGAGKNS